MVDRHGSKRKVLCSSTTSLHSITLLHLSQSTLLLHLLITMPIYNALKVPKLKFLWLCFAFCSCRAQTVKPEATTNALSTDAENLFLTSGKYSSYIDGRMRKCGASFNSTKMRSYNWLVH